MREITTVQGDMFDMIALRELGDEHLSYRIMEENYGYHLIRIFSGGITLNIPAVTQVRRIQLTPWKDALQLP